MQRPLCDYPIGVVALGWCVLHVAKRGLTPFESATSIVQRGGCTDDEDSSLLLAEYYVDEKSSPAERAAYHQKWCEDNKLSEKEEEVRRYLHSLLSEETITDIHHQDTAIMNKLLQIMKTFEIDTPDSEASQLLSEWCLSDDVISSTVGKLDILQQESDDKLIYKTYDLLGTALHTSSGDLIRNCTKSLRGVDPLVFLFTRRGFSDWARPLISTTVFDPANTLCRVTYTSTDDVILSPNRSLSFAMTLFSGILNDPTACPLYLAFENELPAHLMKVEINDTNCSVMYIPDSEELLGSSTASRLAMSLVGVGEMYHPRSKVCRYSDRVVGYFGRTTPATLPKDLLLSESREISIAESSTLTLIHPFVSSDATKSSERDSINDQLKHFYNLIEENIKELPATERDVIRLVLLPSSMRFNGTKDVLETTVSTYNVNGSPAMSDLMELLTLSDVTVLTEVHRGSLSLLPRSFFSEFRGSPDYGIAVVVSDIYSTFVGSILVGKDRSAICVKRMDLFIVGVHLNNSSESIRLSELKQILNWIENDLSIDKFRHLIVGDFNSLVRSDYSSEQLIRISKQRSSSCWENISFDVSDFLISKDYDYISSNGVPTSRRHTAIDHIWGKHHSASCSSSVHPFTLSDHRPVSCSFRKMDLNGE